METAWRDEFVLARDMRVLGRDAELVRKVRGGELIAVTRGVYRRASAIAARSSHPLDDEYLARVRAHHLRSSAPLTFAGVSAAAVWRLPAAEGWPTQVRAVTAQTAGGRSGSLIARSSIGNPAPTAERDGLSVTSLARTVVDVGRTESFIQGVAMADAALHGEARRGLPPRAAITAVDLSEQLGLFGSARGVALCRGVLAFADGKSDSAGESLSRVQMWVAGLPMPELQVSFYDRRGFIGTVDFWWPEYGLIGEFDGVGKYVREDMSHGRTVAQIVMDEKLREDRLRALGHGVSRWGWRTARSAPALRAHLVAAGLPVLR